MASSKQRNPESVSRRAFFATGAKLSLLGAVCATVGSTIIAACISPDSSGKNGLKNKHGSGYGYGYGYGGYGYGCGYAYGYPCS